MAYRIPRSLSLQFFSALCKPQHRTPLRRNHAESEQPMSNSGASFIHPTAIVHPDAVIGEGVCIGPFCTIGSGVKIGDYCQLQSQSHVRGDTEVGDKCTLLTGAVVGADIPGRTVIGVNNVIGYHAVVGVKCQDLKYKEGDECFLYVGNDNDIREFASVHRSSKSEDKTVIGSNNLIMGSCHIAHDCKVGNGNIFANNTLLAGHVVVEDYAHTSGTTVVHQFCHIGSFSFVGGGSVVAQDVPMYSIVAGDRAELRGLNLEGLRRNGFSGLEIRSLKRTYQKIFMSRDLDSGALESRLAKLEKDDEFVSIPVVRMMVQSIRESYEKSRRGICRSRNWAFFPKETEAGTL